MPAGLNLLALSHCSIVVLRLLCTRTTSSSLVLLEVDCLLLDHSSMLTEVAIIEITVDVLTSSKLLS